MIIRNLACAVLALSVWSPVAALESGDAGIYLLVNTKGEVTPKAMRLVEGTNQWMLEDRKPDGTWSNVTCERECTLQTSGKADIQRFFPAETLTQITPDCIHNMAFAFCAYSLKTNATFRGYIFVALVTAQPVVLRLARVTPGGKTGP